MKQLANIMSLKIMCRAKIMRLAKIMSLVSLVSLAASWLPTPVQAQGIRWIKNPFTNQLDALGPAASGLTSLNALTGSTQTFAGVNDTNVTVVISSTGTTHTFTMGWASTLAKARMVSTTVHTDQTNTFGAGLKQLFTSNGTTAGFNLVPFAGDPSSPSNGDSWYSSTTGTFRCRQAGVTLDCIGAGSISGSGSANKFSLWTGASTLTGTTNLGQDAQGAIQATKGFYGPINTITPGATVAYDCSLGNVIALALSANVTTATASNCGAGREITLIHVQDSVARTVVWPSGWVNFNQPDVEPASITMQHATCDAGGCVANSYYVYAGSSGCVHLVGKTSGSADLCVDDAAGTPSSIKLPKVDGTSGQLVKTDGASPANWSYTSVAPTATILATTRAIYGNNFDGSAALTQIIASTYGGTGNGFFKVSGPASTERTFTFPNGNAIISYTVASGAKAFATSAISSGACSSAQTDTATGTLTTDLILATFNADPTATTGYTPVTTGALYIVAWPTADTANYKICNSTASSITPGAVTVNWRVIR